MVFSSKISPETNDAMRMLIAIACVMIYNSIDQHRWSARKIDRQNMPGLTLWGWPDQGSSIIQAREVTGGCIG